MRQWTGNLTLCRPPLRWPHAVSEGYLLIFRLEGCETVFSLYVPDDRNIFLTEGVTMTVYAVPSEDNAYYEVVAFNVHPEQRACIVQHPKSTALRYMFHGGLFGLAIACPVMIYVFFMNYFNGGNIGSGSDEIATFGGLMSLIVLVALPLAYRKGLRHHSSQCSWKAWKSLREQLLMEHQGSLFELGWNSLFSRE